MNNNVKRKGINRYLDKKIEKIYEETINTVLIDGVFYKEILDKCRNKTRIPSEPNTIYNRYIADIEELRKGQTRSLIAEKI